MNQIFKKSIALFLLPLLSLLLAPYAFAQTLTSPSSPNINDSGFQLIICDGPDLSNLPTGTQMTFSGQQVTITHGQTPQIPDGKGDGGMRAYVPCDFNGAMMQIQHLIDVMMVLGVFVAIAGFIYAGYLYISIGFNGNSENRGKAIAVFKTIGIGFIIMLSAWFIVDQILVWLTGSGSGFTYLLGH